MRGEDLAKGRVKRRQYTLDAINNNPGIQVSTLTAALSLNPNVSVSATKVEEYVRELHRAGVIDVDMGKLYPKGWLARAKLEAEQEELARGDIRTFIER